MSSRGRMMNLAIAIDEDFEDALVSGFVLEERWCVLD